jgi:Ca-activated chloride channel family protein
MIAARAQDANTQRPPANEARLLLTAVDKDGHFVNTLRADDLRVLEDGAPQKIADFHQITDRAVSLAIMIDDSASQERTLPAQKLAATSFVDSIIGPNQDEAAVATFTGTLTIEQALTNHVPLLREAIARAEFVPPPGYVRGGLIIGPPPPPSRSPAALAGATAIWDSVIVACNDFFSSSVGQKRRAIILLTDGIDTISKSKLSDAVDRANQANVAIYSIGIGDTKEFGLEKDPLRKLSERTGGRAFFPRKIGDLATIFAEIGQELRAQYVISYIPNRTAGATGKIRVEIVNPVLRKSNVRLYYQQVVRQQ